LKQVIDNSIEIQLHIDVAVDGCTLAFRGSRTATELRVYLNQRRKAIEELRPTATWALKYENTVIPQYEVVGTHAFSLALISDQFYQLCDGIWATGTQLKEHGYFKGLSFQEMVSPDAPNGVWKRKCDDLGIEGGDFSFWAEKDLLILTERINGGYVGSAVMRRVETEYFAQ
jgi:hypothetical protein